LPLPLPLSEPGPILTYLTRLRSANIDQIKLAADHAEAQVREMLNTQAGAILLDLLEKSTSLSQVPISGDERALAARNAQTFILSDLRRIASNETEQILAQGNARGGRHGRRNTAG